MWAGSGSSPGKAKAKAQWHEQEPGWVWPCQARLIKPTGLHESQGWGRLGKARMQYQLARVGAGGRLGQIKLQLLIIGTKMRQEMGRGAVTPCQTGLEQPLACASARSETGNGPDGGAKKTLLLGCGSHW